MIDWRTAGEPKLGQKMTKEQNNIWKEDNERFRQTWQSILFWDRMSFLTAWFAIWLVTALAFHLILRAFDL